MSRRRRGALAAAVAGVVLAGAAVSNAVTEPSETERSGTPPGAVSTARGLADPGPPMALAEVPGEINPVCGTCV